jgi:two-component system sensor histidine kinase ArlS
MPVRLRITILFSLLVLVILGLVCSSVYYISYTSRTNNVRTRLANRAITTAKLLTQSEIFDYNLVKRIDAATTMALKQKTVQAYDHKDQLIYSYSEVKDTFTIAADRLDDARRNGQIYFTMGIKEVVAHFFTDNNHSIVMVVSAYDEEGKAKLKQLQLVLWLSFLSGVIITFAFGYIFSKQLLRPVRKIADEVNEISARDLSRRIESGESKDEWNYLSSTLNQLLDRLRDSFETQRRFISNASHELSTPLTSISSQLEVSLQRDRGADDYRKVMQSVYQDVRQLNKLTQTLLEFAKASGTSGGLEIDLVRIDEIVLRLPYEMAKTNAGYSVSIGFGELPPEEERLLVFGNEELLFLAIKNIVVNACKYSEDKRARVNLSALENDLVITIEDNGVGIPQEEMENIFLPFYRVHETRSNPGFGLGLPLANRIIKLHKGQVKVYSVVNSGTTFTISLPVAGNRKEDF